MLTRLTAGTIVGAVRSRGCGRALDCGVGARHKPFVLLRWGAHRVRIRVRPVRSSSHLGCGKRRIDRHHEHWLSAIAFVGLHASSNEEGEVADATNDRLVNQARNETKSIDMGLQQKRSEGGHRICRHLVIPVVVVVGISEVHQGALDADRHREDEPKEEMQGNVGAWVNALPAPPCARGDELGGVPDDRCDGLRSGC